MFPIVCSMWFRPPNGLLKALWGKQQGWTGSTGVECQHCTGNLAGKEIHTIPVSLIKACTGLWKTTTAMSRKSSTGFFKNIRRLPDKSMSIKVSTGPLRSHTAALMRQYWLFFFIVLACLPSKYLYFNIRSIGILQRSTGTGLVKASEFC